MTAVGSTPAGEATAPSAFAARRARLLGDLRLAARFAMREMRGGLSGFWIFLACIALGVGAIAAVGSVSSMMTEGIAREGRAILGGDLRLSLVQREPGEAEIRSLEALGDLSRSATLRSMARLPDGTNQALAEVKAVDGLYPLFGAVALDPEGLTLEQALAERDGVFGAVAAPEFFERLGLRPGDRVALGSIEVELRARLLKEPDLLSDGFAFAPRLMLSREALAASGLVQPGSLVQNIVKLRLAEGAPPASEVEDTFRERFPDGGFNIRTSDEAAPSLQRSIDRFAQFLTLVGLSALIVGGVGVANAVNAYLDKKRAVIATFKSLGAGGILVSTIYLIQIMTLAGVGVLAGLLIGAIAPFIASGFIQRFVPVAANAGFYPGALTVSALFGLLTALGFALLPLGRTRDVPATALFRQAGITRSPRRIRWAYAGGALAAALAVAGLAIGLANDRIVALVFLGGTIVAFGVLRLVAWGLAAGAAKLPRVPSTPLRLAVGNIHRPGALTPSVVLSLGLGLTLLVTLATIDHDLRREIGTNLASRAPDFFFVDIQNTEIEPFGAAIAELSPGSTLDTAPMLRGRITALNGEDVAKMEVPPEGAWVLRGDRGITYSATLPEGASLADGEWWPADYAGEPLVSFSAEEAGELGLTVGDTVTVNVLGRSITARIANLRTVEWETLSINFVMVFDPAAFAGAPHSWLATLSAPDEADPAATERREQALVNGITNRFPAVTTVRVKEALDQVNGLVAQLATAIRAAAAVALVSSVLVLSGALAAGSRGRIHDAVVLKTLGATRVTLIQAFAAEYMLLGLFTGVFAVGAGALAAWFVVERIMELPFVFDWTVALVTLVVSLVLTVAFGLVGTWRILGQKAAPVLREL
ncbi:ABC transporter permease [Antarcticirhabdus aurantiaca]